MFWETILALCVLVPLCKFFWPTVEPIHGIYRQPGRFFWIKKLLFYTLLRLKHRDSASRKSQRKIDGEDVVDYRKSDWLLQQMEECQTLQNTAQALDSVYFGGFNTDGVRMVVRLGRRHGRYAEVWVMLVIPGIGCLQHTLHPDTTIENTVPDSYTAGGVKIELLQPLERWKVSFNGPLRLCSSDIKEEYLHVRFSFIWQSLVNPFNYDTDMDMSALADAVAREEWSREFWERLKSTHQTHYVQWGAMRGNLHVEGFPSQNIIMTSFRDHTQGYRDWKSLHRYVIHYITLETGEMIMTGRVSIPMTTSLLTVGFLSYGSGQTWTVSSNDFPLWDLENKEPPDNYTFSFIAGGVKYCVTVSVETTTILYQGEDKGSKVHEKFSRFTVNGVAGIGLVEFHYGNNEGQHITIPKSVRLLAGPTQYSGPGSMGDLVNPLGHIIPLGAGVCCCDSLVGGKGAQLAQLTSIKQTLNVDVPNGFCITLAAFDFQVKNEPAIGNSLEKLQETIRSVSLSDLPSVCSAVVEEFAVHTIFPQLKKSIQEHFESIAGYRETGCFCVAVRSSAAGEDGSEASSAGQMETFLGINTADEVYSAVMKCWASAFTYQAVEYRRQHGQPIITEVGVVIQEMVQSEVSGVLFTNDPLTGNPGLMTLDAAYGLGEVVVSGKSDPDTIVVSRNWKNELEIKEKRIGKKTTQVLVTDKGGVTEISTSESNECCLSDEMIRKLCNVGLQLEKYYGSGRDIEWAVSQGNIYLLQARPITTLDLETDEDIIHEFDSPLVNDKELITTANAGEMMPGAVTPLTLSVFIKSADLSMQAFGNLFAQYGVLAHASKSLCLSANNVFLNIMMASVIACCTFMGSKDVMELNLLGESISQNTIKNVKNYVGWMPSLFSQLCWFMRMLFVSKKICKKCDDWGKKLETYKLGEQMDTAKSLYKEIDENLCIYDETWFSSVVKSGICGTYNTILMKVLAGEQDWKVEHYSDVALLLSECDDVYSAEVPAALEELAKEIANAGIEEKFISSDSEQCTELLYGTEHSSLQEKFCEFMKRHGHRCIREAEFFEKSWESEPAKLIKALKSILKTKSYERKFKKGVSVAEAVSQLKTPVSGWTRFVLKRLVPRARKSVGEREWGKSVAVKMMDVFKQAYWKLADLMLREGRLPQKELMFFLTHREIGKLLETRSAKLVTKAVRRKKILPKQMEASFPKISWGYPKAIPQDQKTVDQKSTFVVKGLPVSHGCVTGRARVVKSLDEADSIQAGDILIVVFTDVGWSPYFPLISGLVTELGGLVSHGAVVAREYGIPCVVSIPHVTHLCQTGDLVHLNGMLGTLEKVEETSNTET